MSVVFDLLAAQYRQPAERAAGRSYERLALAVEERAPGLVDRWLVRSEVPVPGALDPLVSTGRVQVHRRRRDWRASDHGVFVTGALLDLRRPLHTVLPAAYDHPSWARVGVLDDLHPLGDPGLARTAAGVVATRADLVRSMDLLLVASDAVADEAEDLLGVPRSRMVVLGTGPDPRFRPDPRGHEVAVAESHQFPPVDGLRPRFVLCEVGRSARHNLDNLARAFGALPPEVHGTHQLVVVGDLTEDDRRGLDELIARPDIGFHDVLLAGRVTDEALVRLFHAAHLVVAPAAHDPSGLAVLEALAAGAPVVCSDLESLRDLVPTEARFDPADPGSITEVILRHCTDPEARQRATGTVPAGRSLDRAAEQAVDALVDLTGRTSRRPSRRAHVALVSPFPPRTSGIADYAAKFVDHLRHHVDVTVFVDDHADDIDAPEGVAVARTSSFEAVEAETLRFDRLVTFLGNSPFHLDALELTLRQGGTVVLHDARLTALYSELALRRPRSLGAGGVGGVLARTHPGRYGDDLVHAEVIDPGTAAERGVHLLGQVAAAADDVLVHSRYAADVIEIDTGVRPDIAFGLPFDPPVRSEDRRPRTGHVVTLGHLTPVKQPELLLDAVELLRPQHQITFSFVGGGPTDYLEYLRGAIASRGLDDVVDVRGFLPDDEYRAAVAEASVAVQLRAFTNGESSAALHDAIAAGVPTLCNRLGSMAEYPDDVVATVAADADAPALAAALGELLDDEERRGRMSAAAVEQAAARSYDRAAALLLDRLDL